MTIRVLVVDDQAMLRAGFRVLLGIEPDIEVVGEAADGRVALDQARALVPDVVLMDIRMPEMDGVTATRELVADPRLASCKVLILTTIDVDEYVYEALRAGASGFLLKDLAPDELVNAIRVVAAGESVVAPKVTRRLLDQFASQLPTSAPGQAAGPDDDGLTEREREVLLLVAQGQSNAEIARGLFLGETTVKTHVAHILAKLGLRDRVQATVYAYESGLIVPGSVQQNR